MAQNRKAPAYQEYAASMLSNRHFRLMSLAERGLLYTMRLECWENNQTPNSPADLAKYFGFSIAEIQNALTNNVKSFFIDENEVFISQELDNYRKNLEEYKAKKIAGGKKGAAIKNERIKKIQDSQEAIPQGDLKETSRSLDKNSTDKINQNQSLGTADNDWCEEYEKADSLINDYQSARGKR